MSNTFKGIRIWKKQVAWRFRRSFFYREVLLLAD